jgi:hypothetical protein
MGDWSVRIQVSSSPAKHSVLALLVAGYTAALSSATATTFIVGDDQGWTMTGVDYVAWVQGKTFAIGDKLGEWSALFMHGSSHPLHCSCCTRIIGTSWQIIAVFNYPSEEHTVTEVGKTDYFACAGGSALSNDRSGSTNITLTAPGTRYFICNIPGHCTAGMRLAVTVAGGGSPPEATPTGDAAGASVRPAMGSFVVKAIAWAMIKLALS